MFVAVVKIDDLNEVGDFRGENDPLQGTSRRHADTNMLLTFKTVVCLYRHTAGQNGRPADAGTHAPAMAGLAAWPNKPCGPIAILPAGS